MDNLLGSIIGEELFFVYGLIGLVIILIIVIIIIDKKESKKKPTNLFDTLNMKAIADPNTNNNQENNSESESTNTEIIEINQYNQETNFQDLEPIPEIKTIASSDINISTDDSIKTSTDTMDSLNEDIYTETELEKTQAQIRVEEITNALKNAKVEEQIQEDKYAKFEEEQEKNAIISYSELKKSFDKLYNENEKIQYLDDNKIPINIEELYQFSSSQEDNNQETSPKVKLDDLSSFTTPETETKPSSTFKSSPLISPVYGIQEPPVKEKKAVDNEIENANQFLQSLKELKNNLD